MKKDTRFFNWLNGVIFFKNGYIMKQSHDDKRVSDCITHKAKMSRITKRHNARVQLYK